MNPRSEYPRPQLVRSSYLNLNGKWQFEIDNSRSGRERGLFKPEAILSKEIIVPFCPESKLSGVEYRDFMYSVWYRREVELIKTPGRRILLHIDACDFQSEVWVNGISVGKHFGGSSPAVYDITDAAADGTNVVTVCAEDDVRSGKQPLGKQSTRFESYGCLYTRTTGIWQTVWIEEVPESYITGMKFYPDIAACSVGVDITVAGDYHGEVEADAYYGGALVGSAVGKVSGHSARLTVSLSTRQLWEVGKGRLYDL
ncbi:MAG: sugar-binding domain-containing protein, partial [Candidatus Flemingiibacterium sp.]